MTFAEFAIFAGACFLFYFLLTPLRKNLEKRLAKFFSGKQKNRVREVIDVTHSKERSEK
jgi:hypothetical protein